MAKVRGTFTNGRWITVYKEVLEKEQELSHQLTLLYREIKEFNRFCCYTPKGDFKQLIQVLEQFRVSYGVHSDQELLY